MARLQEENKVSKENGEKEIKEMQIVYAVEMELLNLDDLEFDESGIKGLDKRVFFIYFNFKKFDRPNL